MKRFSRFGILLSGLLLTGPVIAADSLPNPTSPNLTTVRAAIKAKNYNAALAELKGMVVMYQHPDVYSLMGFSLRKTGDQKQAMTYYNKALDFDPNHKGALEYQGELFVELGQVDKARVNLTRLERLCPLGCEERDDLRKAVAAAPKGG